jgi:hypothetical protein
MITTHAPAIIIPDDSFNARSRPFARTSTSAITIPISATNLSGVTA